MSLPYSKKKGRRGRRGREEEEKNFDSNRFPILLFCVYISSLACQRHR